MQKERIQGFSMHTGKPVIGKQETKEQRNCGVNFKCV